MRLPKDQKASTFFCFNSRTLGRVRLKSRHRWRGREEFQFTHPGKGATLYHLFSLHNPYSFNSRTLGRVRRTIHKEVEEELNVSIHAPWEGCDSGEHALCITT